MQFADRLFDFTKSQIAKTRLVREIEEIRLKGKRTDVAEQVAPAEPGGVRLWICAFFSMPQASTPSS